MADEVIKKLKKFKFLRVLKNIFNYVCYVTDSLLSSQGERGSCVGGSSAFNSPFGHGSRSHNIRSLDNHLSGLSISLSSLPLS